MSLRHLIMQFYSKVHNINKPWIINKPDQNGFSIERGMIFHLNPVKKKKRIQTNVAIHS